MKRLFLLLMVGLMMFLPFFSSSNLHPAAPQPTPNAASLTGQTLLPFLKENLLPNLGVGTFLEKFDGMPASPDSWRPANWDVTVHSRDLTNVTTLSKMNADHGSGCEPPPATHPINTYEDSVFICHDHVMTAINDEGYGVIYLTPNHMVDFTSGEAVVRFDMSTHRNSSRDWIDLWVTPFVDNLQLPLQDWLPDLNGPPRRAVHIFMDTSNNKTVFKAEIYNNFISQSVNGNWWTGYEQFLTPSSTRRDTFELDITRTHIKFGMPQYNFWWIDQDIPALDWAQGVVQFGHHSYNPGKACNFDGTCGPNTWHWDNVSISPAIPFAIIHAIPRYVNGKTDPQAYLLDPAPPNAYLRFVGVGRSLSVSFDGGVSWMPAQEQAVNEHIEEHFKSYWMPIPAGVSQVQFTGQDFWGGGWQVRDISVWSLSASQEAK